MKKVAQEIKDLSQADLAKFEAAGKISISGYEITGEELVVTRKLKDADNPDLGENYDEISIVVMDFAKDPELEMKFIARNIANRVQMLRKDAKLQQDDPVDMWAEVAGSEGVSELKTVLSTKADYINQLLR